MLRERVSQLVEKEKKEEELLAEFRLSAAAAETEIPKAIQRSPTQYFSRY